MGKLLARLQDGSRSGAYRAPRTDEILDAVRDAGFDVARVDLASATDKDALLSRFASALAFPQWFGGNWDALEDCLTDLAWRAGERHVLLIEGFEELRALHPDDFGVLLDILASGAQYWKERGRAFFAVFVDPAHALALPELFRQRGA
jgi:RNAse (barnase) inhibitor barstar